MNFLKKADENVSVIGSTIVVFCALLLVGNIVYQKIQSESVLPSEKSYETVVRDGCEYINIPYAGGYSHKGNCTNDIHKWYNQ